MISLIVAMTKNGVMGRQNQLPWHLPEDLQHFKQLTMGKPIIMGRKTFESIGRVLPGRRHIVITRNREWQRAGVEATHSFAEALQLVARDTEVFVIGGAEIFREAWPQVQKLHLTLIDADIDGDVQFPFLDWKKEFHVVSQSQVLQSSSGLAYQLIEAGRK